MTVFFFNLKRLFKRKSSILTMLLLPVIVMMLTINIRYNRPIVKLAIIDKDKTAATEMLIKELEKSNLILTVNEKDIQAAVSLKKIDYVLIIDSGFTDKIVKGETYKLRTYYDKDSNIHEILDNYLENYLNLLSNKGLDAKGDKSKFYSSLKQIKITTKTIESGDKSKISIRMTLAFQIMFMLMFALGNTLLILRESEDDLNLRTFVAPISVRNYIFQCILSLYVITILQVTIVLTIMCAYYKSSMLEDIFSLFIIFYVFSAVSVALSVFICTVSKKIKKLGTLSSLITVPFCMLGGCFWSNSMMPVSLQHISYLVPTTWAVNAIESIVFGGYNLLQVKIDILIMVMFTVVFLLLGIVTKKDIIK